MIGGDIKGDVGFGAGDGGDDSVAIIPEDDVVVGAFENATFRANCDARKVGAVNLDACDSGFAIGYLDGEGGRKATEIGVWRERPVAEGDVSVGGEDNSVGPIRLKESLIELEGSFTACSSASAGRCFVQ